MSGYELPRCPAVGPGGQRCIGAEGHVGDHFPRVGKTWPREAVEVDEATQSVDISSTTYAMPKCPRAGTLLRSRQGVVVQVLDPSRAPRFDGMPQANEWPTVDVQLGVVSVAGRSGTMPWFEVLGRYGPLTTIGFCELAS